MTGQPAPVEGQALYGIQALLGVDGGIVDGIRPGNILVTWGIVERIYPSEEGVPMSAVVRNGAMIEVVYDPVGVRLPKELFNRPGPYYGGMSPGDPVRTYEIRNGQAMVGRLVVSAGQLGVGSAEVIYRPPHGELPAGHHSLCRITDQRDVTEGTVGAIASAMRLPDAAASWLMDQLFADDWEDI